MEANKCPDKLLDILPHWTTAYEYLIKESPEVPLSDYLVTRLISWD